MKTTLRTILSLLFALSLVGIVSAEGVQERDFMSDLQTELQEEGFSEDEAEAIVEEARKLDWTASEKDDPGLIADSLAKAREQEMEMSPEEQAGVAHGLARSIDALESEGYSDIEASAAVRDSVQEMLRQIKNWKEGDGEENLGEIVRNTVSSTATEKAQSRFGKREGAGSSARAQAGTAGSGKKPEGTPGPDQASAREKPEDTPEQGKR